MVDKVRNEERRMERNKAYPPIIHAKLYGNHFQEIFKFHVLLERQDLCLELVNDFDPYLESRKRFRKEKKKTREDSRTAREETKQPEQFQKKKRQERTRGQLGRRRSNRNNFRKKKRQGRARG
jgi:hypothetical protein